jgi:undecaprenyl phosphate N,N'-diacetylbacillosamine 1-phosphate transferase
MYRRFIKNILDFITAFIGLIVTLPIIILISIVLSLLNNGRILFVQKRPGKHGLAFNTYKFKTMNDKCDTNGALLPDKYRISRFGHFLRKTSLDELPQLFNVLKGEISLVGPRPLLMEYLPLYNELQKRRHELKPGITGWAQVNGRNAISWNKKFELDVWYVNNCTFWLDIKILFLTLIKNFSFGDVNASDDITMEKFTGNN